MHSNFVLNIRIIELSGLHPLPFMRILTTQTVLAQENRYATQCMNRFLQLSLIPSGKGDALVLGLFIHTRCLEKSLQGAANITIEQII